MHSKFTSWSSAGGATLGTSPARPEAVTLPPTVRIELTASTAIQLAEVDDAGGPALQEPEDERQVHGAAPARFKTIRTPRQGRTHRPDRRPRE